jgi:hypothetical protein
MKCFTESELKALLRKTWQHGYENGSRDAAPTQEPRAFISGGIEETIMEGKIIQLLAEV